MGTAKEVYSSPKNEYTKELLSAIPITHPSQRIKNTSQVANNY